MNEESINIAVNNMMSIYNTPGQNLHKSKFITDYNRSITVDELIAFLVRHDFIETDRRDDIYFLCHETYDLIETNNLEEAFRSKMYQEVIQDSSEIEDNEDDDTPLSLDEIQALNLQLAKRNKAERKYVFAILFGISITITVVTQYIRSESNQNHYNKPHIEHLELQNISVDLKHHIDSLIQDKNQLNKKE